MSKKRRISFQPVGSPRAARRDEAMPPPAPSDVDRVVRASLALAPVRPGVQPLLATHPFSADVAVSPCGRLVHIATLRDRPEVRCTWRLPARALHLDWRMLPDSHAAVLVVLSLIHI